MYSALVPNGKKQPLRVEIPETLDDLLSHKEFLKEGWEKLWKPDEDEYFVRFDDFMVRVTNVTLGPRREGALFVFTSKNKKPLAFIFAEDSSESSHYSTLLIYAAYSNSKFKGIASLSVNFVARWAKLNGYRELKALSRRMSGSAMRLFRRYLNFKPQSIVFHRDLKNELD
jgi:hypothetical protein